MYRLAFFLIIACQVSLPAEDEIKVPDFTQGDKIPEGHRHDWNLGPIGARGWIFCDRLVTSDARQIAVTKVEPSSPASESLAEGDVILGVGGKLFSFDPRTELGSAITIAESEAGQGKLALTRWRKGKTEEVVINLPVLGTYSNTAPFDCQKSQRILEQGCKVLAAKIAEPSYADSQDPIVRSLNALALLASGDPAYHTILKREARWGADYSSDSMETWYYGYVTIFLAEYVIATGDESVVPGLRRLAMEAAKGQSRVGSWGHGFAIADGRLGGYGMMNSPGIPLTISLVLAQKAGVNSPEIELAIDRSAKLLRFYVGKGAVPYGDHHPWIENHEDNGKCGMATVLFNLLGEAKEVEFFSRMSIASHGAERDTGHTGNYFNMLWALPAVTQSGKHASGAWMKEFGNWYFDLARCSDGSFIHQGPPEPDHDSYEGWDCTGAYLLGYAMPLKKIYLTGKQPSIAPQLDETASISLINDGRGWTNKDRNSAYDQLSEEELFQRLASWSPIVRERTAMALGRRKPVSVERVIEMLKSPQMEARYGACQALIAIRRRGAPAMGALQECLSSEDLWLRIKAAEALASIGEPAIKAVPQLLELLAQVETEKDPRGMQQRYLSFALFDDSGLLSRSLKNVDRNALYQAVRAGLNNEDGRARGSIASVYRNLSVEEIKPLLPAIYAAAVQPAPSGEMFADTVRVEGLRVLAQNRIDEGIAATVHYARNQNPWSSENRTPEIMEILVSYGTHAKRVLPELKKLERYFAVEEKDFPRNLMAQKAKCVRDTIAKIEASTDTPELIKLEE